MIYNFFTTDNFYKDIKLWREKITNYTLYFFSIFGFFLYIPSLYRSMNENNIFLSIIFSLIYLICLILTFSKSTNYVVKAISGTTLFYCLSILLFIYIGPKSYGSIWLFSSTIFAALTLGNRGAITSLILNIFLLLTFLFLIKHNTFSWQENDSFISWIIQTITFVMLNFLAVLANYSFVTSFRLLLNRTIESRNASMIGLAKLAEYRDNQTGDHLVIVQKYTYLLASELKRDSIYSNEITDEYLLDISLSSILHDIGKVGICDSILLKQGTLSTEEYQSIKEHPLIGYNVIMEINKNISGHSPYTMGSEIAKNHHEKWDGTGYPNGLKGKEIPLSARIVSVVDVYDALTSTRSYKDAYTHKEAIESIKNSKGTHFDPIIVDAFIKISKDIELEGLE